MDVLTHAHVPGSNALEHNLEAASGAEVEVELGVDLDPTQLPRGRMIGILFITETRNHQQDGTEGLPMGDMTVIQTRWTVIPPTAAPLTITRLITAEGGGASGPRPPKIR